MSGSKKKRPGPAPRAERVAQKVRLQERRKKALAMMTELGATYEQVAQSLGYYDRSHAARDIAEAIAEIPKPSTDVMRQVLLDKMSHLEQRILPTIRGNPQPGVAQPPLTDTQLRAAALIVKITNQVTKLLPGVLAPIQMEHSATIDGVDVTKLSETGLRKVVAGEALTEHDYKVDHVASTHMAHPTNGTATNGVPAKPGPTSGSGSGTPQA